MELRLQAFESCPAWLLGTQLCSSGRTASALNSSPGPGTVEISIVVAVDHATVCVSNFVNYALESVNLLYVCDTILLSVYDTMVFSPKYISI